MSSAQSPSPLVSSQRHNRHLVDALAALVLAVLIYATARLWLAWSVPATPGSPLWLTAGIAFALVYWRGFALLPGVFIGALVAGVPVFTAASMNVGPAYAVAAGDALTLTAQTAFGVWLIRRAVRRDSFLAAPIDVFRFVGIAAVTALPSASFSSYLAFAVLGQTLPYIMVWLPQWFGATASIILVAGFVVAATGHLTVSWKPMRIVEAVIVSVLTLMMLQLLFYGWVVAGPTPMPFLIFPFLMWIGFRFAQQELAVMLLVVAGVALSATGAGRGPFAAYSFQEGLLNVELFLIVLAAGSFALGAAALQSRRSTRALRRLNTTLEQRVRQRTDALANANQELKRYRAGLEEIVAVRTADLELANREIESFSYSVSHDLRSPLRAIDGYSHALLEDYGDVLDAKGRDYLYRCRAASQRMGILIDDVLLLSRVTRHELDLNHVDLSALAHEVVSEIRAADETRDVQFSIEDGMAVRGDEHLLRVVVENLIGNAWKYSVRNPQARIEFGSRPAPDEQVFYVRDNGIGFDMAYLDKLFGPFQRLHDADEFEGTGIGLATVARVMVRHGGRVWAEGEVNEGATFYFAFDQSGRTTGPRKAIQSGPREAISTGSQPSSTESGVRKAV